MIGPISFEAKQTGERNARNWHVAFDAAGAGNVAWSRCATSASAARPRSASSPRVAAYRRMIGDVTECRADHRQRHPQADTRVIGLGEESIAEDEGHLKRVHDHPRACTPAGGARERTT
jgi:hypothetical protein